MILASELGFLDIVETLLENKADINQNGYRGRLDLILHIVSIFLNKRMMNHLLSIYRTALMAAAASGQKEVLKLLITNNAALDLKTTIDHDCVGDQNCNEILAFGVT